MKRSLLLVLTLGLVFAATPALAQSAPVANPHSAAAALARSTASASSFPLPAGVAWTTKVTRRPDLVNASQTVVVSRKARGSFSPSALLHYLVAHPVSGTVSAPPVPIAPGQTVVEYDPKPTATTQGKVQLFFHGSQVALELDVSIGWAPLRPADTKVPTTQAGVTVEVWPGQSYASATVPDWPHQVIHATGPGVTSLVHYLNGLQPQGPFPYGAGACTVPLFDGSTPRFTFHTAHHVVVFQYISNCQKFNVSVDGKHRPTLAASRQPLDPTTLVMTRLLHLVP